MLELIKRNTPRIADQFILKTIESDNGYDCYEIYASGTALGLDAKEAYKDENVTLSL